NRALRLAWHSRDRRPFVAGDIDGDHERVDVDLLADLLDRRPDVGGPEVTGLVVGEGKTEARRFVREQEVHGVGDRTAGLAVLDPSEIYEIDLAVLRGGEKLLPVCPD